MADIFGGIKLNEVGPGNAKSGQEHDKTPEGKNSPSQDGSGRAEEQAKKERAAALKREAELRTAIQQYDQFLGSVAYIEENRAALEKAERECKSINQDRDAYSTSWTRAINSARQDWQNRQGQKATEAENIRINLRTTAESEKSNRRKRLSSEEMKLKGDLRSVEKKQSSILEEQKQCQSELDHIDQFKIAGFDCNASVRDFLIERQQKGCLSASQKDLCSMPVQEFAKGRMASPQDLKSLEDRFINTAFLKEAINFKGSGKTFKRLVTLVHVILTILFLLIVVLEKNVSGGVFTFPVAFYRLCFEMVTGALFCGVVLFFVVGIISKKNENVAIAGFAIGVVIGAIWGTYYGIVNWPLTMEANKYWVRIICAVIAGFAPRLLGVPLGWIFEQTKIFLQKDYKILFKSADSFEQEQSDNTVLKGEIDTMIVCYLRHDELMQYLSQSARLETEKSLKNRIQQLSEQLQSAKAQQKTLEGQIRQLDDKQSRMAQQNEDTDRRLRENLAEVDRKYGASTMPDFTLRKNLLKADQQVLNKMELKWRVSSVGTGDRAGALRAFDLATKSAREERDRIRKRIEESTKQIHDWFSSGQLPPLEKDIRRMDGTGRAEWRYRPESFLCLCAPKDLTSQEILPQVFRYDGKPIYIAYQGNHLDSMRTTQAVRGLWKAFSKMVPKELMRMALLDPSGRLRLSYRSMELEDWQEFGEYAQEGAAPAGSGRISCLFDSGGRRDSSIAQYDGELGEQISKYQEYVIQHRDSIRSLQLGGESSNYDKMNYLRIHENATPNPMPYYVTFVIVPPDGFFDSAISLLPNMSGLIQENMGYKNGFLPIVIYAQDSVANGWTDFVESVKRNGIAVSL